ncbi:unnamed protein product [Caenorhabditis bovis]|uniref:protein-tyrosine-phosphatase n=1 Tax=Caenorhabditis bovis TaxID=2654633 RepID=A0A8S1EUI4_9PELO|nr:unnamed protein product [Caenorhabditis bovis]
MVFLIFLVTSCCISIVSSSSILVDFSAYAVSRPQAYLIEYSPPVGYPPSGSAVDGNTFFSEINGTISATEYVINVSAILDNGMRQKVASFSVFSSPDAPSLDSIETTEHEATISYFPPQGQNITFQIEYFPEGHKEYANSIDTKAALVRLRGLDAGTTFRLRIRSVYMGVYSQQLIDTTFVTQGASNYDYSSSVETGYSVRTLPPNIFSASTTLATTESSYEYSQEEETATRSMPLETTEMVMVSTTTTMPSVTTIITPSTTSSEIITTLTPIITTSTKRAAEVVDSGDLGSDHPTESHGEPFIDLDTMIREYGEPSDIGLSDETNMLRLDWDAPDDAPCDAFFVNYTILSLSKPRSFSLATSDEHAKIKFFTDHTLDIRVFCMLAGALSKTWWAHRIAHLSKPKAIENLRVVNTTTDDFYVSTIKIAWDWPTYHDFVHYRIVVSYGLKDTSSTQEIEVTSKQDFIEIDKLEAANAYKISIRNSSVELSLTSKPTVIEQITPPIISSTVYPGQISSTSININFGDSDPEQGRFDYYLLTFSGNNKNISKKVEMDQEKSFTFTKLIPGKTYQFSVYTVYKGVKSRPVSADVTTYPLKVNKLYPVVGRDYVVLYWDIENFADSDCRFRLSYNADNIPTVSVELKGASRHRFAGLQSDVYYTFTITVIMGTAKAAAESESEMGSRELVVSFDNDHSVFSELNGAPENFAVIVSDDTSLNDDNYELKSWFEVKDEDVWGAYRASPSTWNPFDSDRVRHAAFTVGTDDCVKRSLDEPYCNGILRANTDYRVKIRMYTDTMVAMESDWGRIEGEKSDANDDESSEDDESNDRRFPCHIEEEERNESLTGDKMMVEKTQKTQEVSRPPRNTEQVDVMKMLAGTNLLEVPEFDGRQENWSPFWEMFEVLVDKQNAPNVVKFNVLRKACRGDAYEQIRKYPADGSAYHEAVKRLQAVYGNTEKQFRKLLSQLQEVKPARDDIRSCRAVFNTCSVIVYGLKKLNQEVDNAVLKELIRKKFPRWVNHKLLKNEARKDDAKDASAESMLEDIEDMISLREAEDSDSEELSGKIKALKDQVARAEEPCSYCGLANHKSDTCRKFGSLDLRREKAGKDGLCFNCLKKGHYSTQCRKEQGCEPGIEAMMELDGIGINEKDPTDSEIMKNFRETVEMSLTGEITVRWPWKEEKKWQLADNRTVAWQRLMQTYNALHQKKEWELMLEIFKKQEIDGIIEEVTSKGQSPVYYIPYQIVKNDNSATTKLRIVFDASSHRKGCISLNDAIHQGPVILPELVGIILRCRTARYVLIADVEKAFHQIRLHKEDRDSTRFFMLKDEKKPPTADNVKIMRFTRIPFGVNASPFLLAVSIQHFFENAQTSEILQEAVGRNLYVTDESQVQQEQTPEESVKEEESDETPTRRNPTRACRRPRGWVTQLASIMMILALLIMNVGAVPSKDLPSYEEVKLNQTLGRQEGVLKTVDNRTVLNPQKLIADTRHINVRKSQVTSTVAPLKASLITTTVAATTKKTDSDKKKNQIKRLFMKNKHIDRLDNGILLRKDDSEIICTNNGVNLIDKGINTKMNYKICSNNYCVSDITPSFITNIALPREEMISIHKISWKKAIGNRYGIVEKECPARDTCTKIDCIICPDIVWNPHCAPIRFAILIAIGPKGKENTITKKFNQPIVAEKCKVLCGTKNNYFLAQGILVYVPSTDYVAEQSDEHGKASDSTIFEIHAPDNTGFFSQIGHIISSTIQHAIFSRSSSRWTKVRPNNLTIRKRGGARYSTKDAYKSEVREDKGRIFMSANNAIFMLSQAQLMKVIAQQGARGPSRIRICVFCEKGHWPSECSNTHSTVEERKTVQRQKGLCPICLRKGHNALRCRAPRTDTCKVKQCEKKGLIHHALLCKKQPGKEEEPAAAQALEEMDAEEILRSPSPNKEI